MPNKVIKLYMAATEFCLGGKGGGGLELTVQFFCLKDVSLGQSAEQTCATQRYQRRGPGDRVRAAGSQGSLRAIPFSR